MDTRALILAGGGKSGHRWPYPNDLGYTRHMVPIQGEPLIHRTQRLLHEQGLPDVRVLADLDCPEYVTSGTHEVPRPVDRGWVQEWEPSQHLWLDRGRTIIIYGDCYLTDHLLDAMCADPGTPWNVYARHGASGAQGRAPGGPATQAHGGGHTGKWYGEMFGWVFTDKAVPLLRASQQRAIRYKETGHWDRALGWEVYRLSQGKKPSHHHKGKHFIDWDDASDDFDFPHDHDVWAALNPDLA